MSYNELYLINSRISGRGREREREREKERKREREREREKERKREKQSPLEVYRFISGLSVFWRHLEAFRAFWSLLGAFLEPLGVIENHLG